MLHHSFARNGQQLAAGGIHGVVNVFDLPLRHPLGEFPALQAAPAALAVSPDAPSVPVPNLSF